MKKHILLLLLLVSSCVATDISYTDDFKGEWICDQLPIGNFADTIMLYVDDDMTVVIDDIVYMKNYRINNYTLVCGWTIEINGVEFLFLDATLSSNDELLLRWKPVDFYYPYTTVFKRI